MKACYIFFHARSSWPIATLSIETKKMTDNFSESSFDTTNDFFLSESKLKLKYSSKEYLLEKEDRIKIHDNLLDRMYFV